MNKKTKVTLFICSKAIQACGLYCLYRYHKFALKKAINKAYSKGIDDCVDNFVKGFVFTNSKVVTVESKHNGSVTVKTIG